MALTNDANIIDSITRESKNYSLTQNVCIEYILCGFE